MWLVRWHSALQPVVSDLDLIAAADRPLNPIDALVEAGPPPGRGLDLDVYPAAWLRAPTQDPPWRQAIRWDRDGVPEIRSAGSRFDWAPELAVVRQHGIRVAGPDVSTMLGTVPATILLEACRASIAVWAGRAHFGSPASGVLNAARAWLYWSERRIASKLEGGRWAADQIDDPTLIQRALDYQETGRPQAFPDQDVAAFIRTVYARIREPPPG
jgi:hypothetical protein